MDIKDIFEYNWYCRRKFLEGWETLPWEKLVKDRGASFGSLRNIFLHSVGAEQFWLRRLARRREAKRCDYDREFKDLESMRKYVHEVEAESRAYLSKLKTGDLDRIFAKRVIRVEDVLMHVVEEEIHHRGELLGLMWQIDVEPPLKDWFDWTSETHKKTSR